MAERDIWVATEGYLADPLREAALRAAVDLSKGWLRRSERPVDDCEVDEILVVAERLHSWLRAEPGA